MYIPKFEFYDFVTAICSRDVCKSFIRDNMLQHVAKREQAWMTSILVKLRVSFKRKDRSNALHSLFLSIHVLTDVLHQV